MVKISIIIPVFNAESTIQTTLKNIKQQTLNDIEIICIDDGSTDNTAMIINNEINHDSRISYYYQSNAGAGSARNCGLMKASGKYISFMDADDKFCEENNLKEMFNVAEKNASNICGGYIQFWEEKSKKFINRHQINSVGIINYEDYQVITGFSRFIYNRQFLIDNDIFFPPYRVYEDPVFLLKAMCAAKKFQYIDIPTYCYMGTHQNKNMNIRKIKDFLKGLTDVFILSEQNNLKKLYNDTYEALTKQACFYIEKDFSMMDDELFSKILYINSIIRWDFLDNHDAKNVLPILDFTKELSIKYYRISNSVFIKTLRRIKSVLRGQR